MYSTVKRSWHWRVDPGRLFWDSQSQPGTPACLCGAFPPLHLADGVARSRRLVWGESGWHQYHHVRAVHLGAAVPQPPLQEIQSPGSGRPRGRGGRGAGMQAVQRRGIGARAWCWAGGQMHLVWRLGTSTGWSIRGTVQLCHPSQPWDAQAWTAQCHREATTPQSVLCVQPQPEGTGERQESGVGIGKSKDVEWDCTKALLGGGEHQSCGTCF